MKRVVRGALFGAAIIATWLAGPPTARALQPRPPGADDANTLEPRTIDLAAAALKDDPAEARSHADACQGGDRNACVMLGVDYELGAGVTQSPTRALELYRAGCGQKIQLACALEGWRLILDQRAKDPRRGRQLVDAACGAEEPFGCYLLGLLALTGRGEAKSAPRAARLFRQSCDAGTFAACRALAYMLDVGAGVKRDSAAAVKLLEHACGGSHGDSCDHLGALFWNGRGVVASREHAQELFEKGCRLGSASGCTHLGQALFAHGKQAEARPFLELACSSGDVTGCRWLGVWQKLLGSSADAVQPLTRACRGNDGLSCRALGYLYQEGKGAKGDKTTAGELFERACELGDGVGCYNWAVALERRGDFAAALAPVRKACDLDAKSGCNELGRLSYLGKGTAKNPALARKLWQKLCDADFADGCMGLALAYEEGQGARVDLAKAADLYRKSCDLNDANGCALLADYYREGKGVTRDLAVAFTLFERSCRAKFLNACLHLGQAYQWGEGVLVNKAKALEVYVSACNQGEGFGCYDAGFMQMKNKDPKSAVAYFEKGGGLDDPAACGELGIAYEEGRGLTTNVTRAGELYEKSCAAGNAVGCDRLAHLLADNCYGAHQMT